MLQFNKFGFSFFFLIYVSNLKLCLCQEICYHAFIKHQKSELLYL